MKLVFASDHAGISLRSELATYARENGHQVTEVGAESTDSFDYPDAADLGVAMIKSGEAERGVFICGSGTGICIRANRYQFIRAANCTSVEMAELARLHNDANVLCLGERITNNILARAILDAFLTTANDSEERHARRVRKLDAPVIG